MSKMKKRFNRRERRTLLYKSRVKAGCLLMALSLAMLAPGAGQVHAADADQKVEKKAVSENKTKSDKDRSDKKKDEKKDPDAEQEDKETETDTGKPVQAPRETAIPQPSATPRTPAEEPTGPAEDQTGDQASTDESSQGPEADGVTEPAVTGTPGGSVSADAGAGGASGSPEGDGQADGASGGETGAQGDGPAQSQPTRSAEDPGTSVTYVPDAPDSGSAYAEETEPVPIVGVVEGASTIIVGGLVPATQEETPDQGSDGQGGESQNEELQNNELQDEELQNGEGSDIERPDEEEDGEEPQSRVAGSTPLVGGVIAGEGTGGSAGTKTTPTAAPSRTPAGGSTGDRTAAVTARPTASTAPASSPASQQEQQVALNDSSAGQQQATSTAGSNPLAGLRRAGVATEDSTKIIPFIVAGVAALAAIIAFAVLKVRKGRRGPEDMKDNTRGQSDQEQE